jgi:hypothetical protein
LAFGKKQSNDRETLLISQESKHLSELSNGERSKEAEYEANRGKHVTKAETECAKRASCLRKYLVKCHKRCLDRVIKKSEWINKENKRGQTPLLKSIDCKSDISLIELLFQNGANILHVNSEGKQRCTML